jgi:hypothetical protein
MNEWLSYLLLYSLPLRCTWGIQSSPYWDETHPFLFLALTFHREGHLCLQEMDWRPNTANKCKTNRSWLQFQPWACYLPVVKWPHRRQQGSCPKESHDAVYSITLGYFFRLTLEKQLFLLNGRSLLCTLYPSSQTWVLPPHWEPPMISTLPVRQLLWPILKAFGPLPGHLISSSCLLLSNLAKITRVKQFTNI